LLGFNPFIFLTRPFSLNKIFLHYDETVMGMSYTTMNNSSDTMMRVVRRGNARGTHHRSSSRIKDKEERGKEKGVIADCEKRGRTVSSHHTGLTGVHHQVVAMMVKEGEADIYFLTRPFLCLKSFLLSDKTFALS
jgi:hypothetical protein